MRVKTYSLATLNALGIGTTYPLTMEEYMLVLCLMRRLTL